MFPRKSSNLDLSPSHDLNLRALLHAPTQVREGRGSTTTIVLHFALFVFHFSFSPGTNIRSASLAYHG
jgi:hypothetical protein